MIKMLKVDNAGAGVAVVHLVGGFFSLVAKDWNYWYMTGKIKYCFGEKQNG